MNRILELQSKIKDSFTDIDTCNIDTIVEVVDDYMRIYTKLLKNWLTSDLVKDNIQSMYDLQKTTGIRQTFVTNGLNLVCVSDVYNDYISDFKEFINDIIDIDEAAIKSEDVQRKIDNLIINDMGFIEKLFSREVTNDHYIPNMDIGNILTQLELIPSILLYMDSKELSKFIRNYDLSGTYCEYKKKMIWILIDSIFTYNGNVLTELLNIFNNTMTDIMKRDLIPSNNIGMKII